METVDVISDAALIRLAAAGDGDGFKALMRGHCGRLLRGARALCGDHQQSEDLVQETLLEAWRGLERFDGCCQFSTRFVKQVVGRCGVSLHELQRARAIGPCGWELDAGAGPGLLMTHLQKARDLSRVAVLRSRLRFDAGEVCGALADLLAVFKLGRDCAVSPWVVATLVDAAIEERAGELLALQLPGLSQAQVEDVTGELRRLPAGWSAAEVPGAEGENVSDWLDRWIASESARPGAAATGGALLQAFAGDFGEGLGSESDAAELKGDRDAMLKSLTIAELQGAVIQLWKDQQELVSLLKLPLAERAQPLQRLSARLQAAGAGSGCRQPLHCEQRRMRSCIFRGCCWRGCVWSIVRRLVVLS